MIVGKNPHARMKTDLGPNCYSPTYWKYGLGYVQLTFNFLISKAGNNAYFRGLL